MTTRTYAYTFTAPGTLTAPGGRFFFVKSASAAVNISTRGSTTAPMVFTAVGAGLKFGPVAPELRWTYLDIESATPQVVEVIVSDDADVDVANTVNVAGSVMVTNVLGVGLNTPARIAVGTAETALAAANVSRRSITFQAMNANTAAVNVGTAGSVSATRGVELQPGSSAGFESSAAFVAWAASGSQQVQVIEEI